MIHVAARSRPDAFVELVEKPGATHLDELRAENGSLDGLTQADLKPIWRQGSGLLRDQYGWICAYAAQRISPTTGQASVDHFAPKSDAPELAYVWTNYRLACQLMNSRKRDFSDVLDPFEIKDGWFQLDIDTYLIRPDPQLDEATRNQVQATLDRLKLNERDEHVDERCTYVTDVLSGATTPAWLQRNAPFVYSELVRQKRIVPIGNPSPPAVSRRDA